MFGFPHDQPRTNDLEINLIKQMGGNNLLHLPDNVQRANWLLKE